MQKSRISEVIRDFILMLMLFDDVTEIRIDLIIKSGTVCNIDETVLRLGLVREYTGVRIAHEHFCERRVYAVESDVKSCRACTAVIMGNDLHVVS